jgi:acetyl-CoA synthetase
LAFFAPWNAGATIMMLNQPRFDARALLDTLVERKVTGFFAPPTEWRMLLQEDLGARPVALREVVAAGEPLNPEVIEQVRRAWGLTVRDGWGQTELTVQIANTPGQGITVGAIGRTSPGCVVTVLDDEGQEVDEGELCLADDAAPARPDTGPLTGGWFAAAYRGQVLSQRRCRAPQPRWGLYLHRPRG